MQIMMNEDYGKLKKGRFYTPLKIGFFTKTDPERLTATVFHQGLGHLLNEDIFDIKIRRVSK